MSVTIVSLSGKNLARGRNRYFKAGSISVAGGFTLDSEETGIHLDVLSTHPRGKEPANMEISNEEAIALAYALMKEAGLGEVFWFSCEADFAFRYDQAACRACRHGENCEIDHEQGTSYYALPATERERLRKLALDHVTGNDHLNETAADILTELAESEAPPV